MRRNRQYGAEFKQEAVWMVLGDGRAIRGVEREFVMAMDLLKC